MKPILHPVYDARKPKSIQALFGKIAPTYDCLNTLISFGCHRSWKKKLVQACKIEPHFSVLDCATGTGDLAFLFESHAPPPKQIVGVDFCLQMLEQAKRKALQKKSRVTFQQADVLQLPFDPESFDRVSISFGIRNTQKTEQALREMARVTRPSGQIAILEFGQPPPGILRALFRLYSTQWIPFLGGLWSGDTEAYRYLNTSSAHYPCGEAFLKLAQETGLFSATSVQALQGGIVYLYLLTRRGLGS